MHWEPVAQLCSSQLTQCRSRNQSQFAKFRDGWPLPQHVVALPLDCMKNFLATPAEEFDIHCQFAVNLLDERQSALKPIIGPIHFKGHQIAEGSRVASSGDVVLGYTKSLHIT